MFLMWRELLEATKPLLKKSMNAALQAVIAGPLDFNVLSDFFMVI